LTKPRAVIFDIDGTLANCDHRRHLVDFKNYENTGKKNWDEFKRLASIDTPIGDIVELLRHFYLLGFAIVLCTGRSSDQYGQTYDWLKRYGIGFDDLFMREPGCFRPDDVVKRELLALIRKKYDPYLVVDDRDSVVAMWRSEGLTCLQCAPGNF